MKFINAAWNETYAANGYLQQPFLNAQQLAELDAILAKYLNEPVSAGFIISNQTMDTETAKQMNADINRVIAPSIDQYVEDYEIFFSVAATKTNTTNSALKLHTDRCFIEEDKITPINLWIPLCDVNEENGTLCIFEKSHRFTYTYRGINNFEYYMADDYLDYIRRHCLKCVSMNRGEVLFYHPGIIHGSANNYSAAIRHVLLVTLVPKNGTIIYCHQEHHWSNPFDFIDVYQADRDFWIMPNQPNPKNVLKRLYRKRNTKPKVAIQDLKNIAGIK